jgi:hypothetical protein
MRYSLFVFSAGPVWFSPESCGRRLLFIVPIDSRGAGQQHRTLLAARRFCLLLLIFGTGQSRSCFRAQGSLVFVTAPGFGVSGRRSCCVICVLAGSAPALIWSLWISGFISPCSAHSQLRFRLCRPESFSFLLERGGFSSLDGACRRVSSGLLLELVLFFTAYELLVEMFMRR